MGLDATVMCNCFREGKTSPPPFPREWLEVDYEGYLNLKSEHDCESNWNRHYEWEQSCCEHNGMDFVARRISNWTGYRQFQGDLGEIGWQKFPVLKAQLPNGNGGLTAAAASAEAIVELAIFTASGQIGVKTVLVDTSSGEGLYEHVAAYGGVFILSGSRGINVGLSESDFFAVDPNSGEFRFRTTRFRQFNKSGRRVMGQNDDIVWEDLNSGMVYESGIPISGKQIPWGDGRWENSLGQARFEYPAEFHVEQRPRLVDDFAFIVESLKVVFDASVQTGNPVRWC